MVIGKLAPMPWHGSLGRRTPGVPRTIPDTVIPVASMTPILFVRLESNVALGGLLQVRLKPVSATPGQLGVGSLIVGQGSAERVAPMGGVVGVEVGEEGQPASSTARSSVGTLRLAFILFSRTAIPNE